jgi:hypothetical protein
VSWTLLQVVVAVMLENFSTASDREKEKVHSHVCVCICIRMYLYLILENVSTASEREKKRCMNTCMYNMYECVFTASKF